MAVTQYLANTVVVLVDVLDEHAIGGFRRVGLHIDRHGFVEIPRDGSPEVTELLTEAGVVEWRGDQENSALVLTHDWYARLADSITALGRGWKRVR